MLRPGYERQLWDGLSIACEPIAYFVRKKPYMTLERQTCVKYLLLATLLLSPLTMADDVEEPRWELLTTLDTPLPAPQRGCRGN